MSLSVVSSPTPSADIFELITSYIQSISSPESLEYDDVQSFGLDTQVSPSSPATAQAKAVVTSIRGAGEYEMLTEDLNSDYLKEMLDFCVFSGDLAYHSTSDQTSPLIKLCVVSLFPRETLSKSHNMVKLPHIDILGTLPSVRDFTLYDRDSSARELYEDLDCELQFTLEVMDNCVFPQELVGPFAKALDAINKSPFMSYLLARWPDRPVEETKPEQLVVYWLIATDPRCRRWTAGLLKSVSSLEMTKNLRTKLLQELKEIMKFKTQVEFKTYFSDGMNEMARIRRVITSAINQLFHDNVQNRRIAHGVKPVRRGGCTPNKKNAKQSSLRQTFIPPSESSPDTHSEGETSAARTSTFKEMKEYHVWDEGDGRSTDVWNTTGSYEVGFLYAIR